MPPTASATAPVSVPAVLPVRYLSVSSLQRFWRCPEQWRRHYLLREREPASPAMLLGKAVGEAIGHHFTARLAGAPLKGTEARESFHHALELAAAFAALDGNGLNGAELADLRTRGEQVLAIYLASSLVAELEAEQVIAVKQRHELRFPGAQWTFLAYLDLVTARGTVVDVKVKARHLGEGEARRDPQARAYALVRSLDPTADPERPPRLVFHSLRHGKNPEAREVPEGGIIHSAGELAAFQARLVRTARLIAECARSGDWGYASPQGWWCSERCPAWRSCPGGLAA